ncbi:nucleoside phosphorylase [Streptococcus merionis]|uniref:nucleoside phosphorylase n=1 Tax=Streptococcus merionis TaxID=400065 RepID=UPI003511100F
MLLEEFDPAPGVFEPHMSLDDDTEVAEICDTVILPFSGELFQKILSLDGVRYGGSKFNINGEQKWYIYEQDGQKVAVMLAQLGAPALIGTLECLKSLGVKRFILFGTCGVLNDRLECNKLIVPTSAFRDEGISYHYAPVSDEIAYPEEHLERFCAILDKHGIDYVKTKGWSTDAIFRETADKVKRRSDAGAEVVDMEWASVAAWSQFRQAETYHFFYTSDYVDVDNGWAMRDGHEEDQLMTFFEIALTIAQEV